MHNGLVGRHISGWGPAAPRSTNERSAEVPPPLPKARSRRLPRSVAFSTTRCLPSRSRRRKEAGSKAGEPPPNLLTPPAALPAPAQALGAPCPFSSPLPRHPSRPLFRLLLPRRLAGVSFPPPLSKARFHFLAPARFLPTDPRQAPTLGSPGPRAERCLPGLNHSELPSGAPARLTPPPSLGRPVVGSIRR